MKIFIIFCNTLFELSFLKKMYNINLKDDFNKIIFVEHPCHFTKYHFSKTKLCYHKATMLEYFKYLKANNIKNCSYINVFEFSKNFYNKNIQYFCIDPLDKGIINELKKNNVNIFENKNFLLSYSEHIKIFNEELKENIRFTSFYEKIKTKYAFNYKSMDVENRLSFPIELISKIPNRINKMSNYNNKKHKDTINISRNYINDNFKNNPPYYTYEIPIILPINHKDSLKYLDEFLEFYALKNFSDYQDAIISPKLSLDGAILLYHSGISSSLNNGLLTINIILERIFKKFQYNNTDKKEYIRIIENLFRQFSFREYQLYCFINEKLYNEIINSNYLDCKIEKLDISLYNGTTDIKILDDFIKLAFHYGYMHHIIRLMLFSIYFLFKDIHPKHCVQWMMEFACDSYEFLMIGNVYLMCYSNTYKNKNFGFSKSYIHSSNYLNKMSIGYKANDYGNWNILFYNFVKKKYNKLKKFSARMPFLKNIIKK